MCVGEEIFGSVRAVELEWNHHDSFTKDQCSMTVRRILWIHTFVVIIFLYLPAIGHLRLLFDFLSTPSVFIRPIAWLLISYLLLFYPLLLIIALVRDKPGEYTLIWDLFYGSLLYFYTLHMAIPRIE
tara:strand:- start:252 stop:632 length:381 start_codon:yes stop_codon:yes gene_type:complete